MQNGVGPIWGEAKQRFRDQIRFYRHALLKSNDFSSLHDPSRTPHPHSDAQSLECSLLLLLGRYDEAILHLQKFNQENAQQCPKTSLNFGFLYSGLLDLVLRLPSTGADSYVDEARALPLLLHAIHNHATDRPDTLGFAHMLIGQMLEKQGRSVDSQLHAKISADYLKSAPSFLDNAYLSGGCPLPL